MSQYDELEPKPVWQIFGLMTRVPRGSGNEAAVQQTLRGWAEEHGLGVKQDATGNLLISIPASPGHEGAAPILLQGHSDMVCVKEDSSKHDFLKDPIRMIVDGDFIHADGTTLGADNGIGVASALAVLADPGLKHGPLEVLVTIDEETGLTGANGLQGGWLTAADCLPAHDLLDRIFHQGEALARYRDAVAPALWPGVEANLLALLQLSLDLDGGRYPSLPRFIDELAAAAGDGNGIKSGRDLSAKTISPPA